MSGAFDISAIVNREWRQGAVLGPGLAGLAREHAPEFVGMSDTDWLILTSHDCDITNPSIEKEPFVEVLKADVCYDRAANQLYLSGRNPRILEFSISRNEKEVLLSLTAHNRWMVPRSLLMNGSPKDFFSDNERRLIAEWLAKRYIRAAFPTAFDQRWRSKSKNWRELLKSYSDWVQGVYVRLNTSDELEKEIPYKCEFIFAVPELMLDRIEWVKKRTEMVWAIEKFWNQFQPAIQLSKINVRGTDDITLADIESYQRFDADWVSFEDETATPSIMNDMA